MTAPKYFVDTLRLLKTAFPDGLSDEEYLPVVAMLYPFMSNRNLADVMSAFTGLDWGVAMNDMWKAQDVHSFAPEVVARLRERLLVAGFEAWSRED